MNKKSKGTIHGFFQQVTIIKKSFLPTKMGYARIGLPWDPPQIDLRLNRENQIIGGSYDI